ncbi:MAG: hypothetical protein ACP5TL_02265 [Candidatus Micrarchaeia archaeon]
MTKNIYESKHYTRLILIPVILLFISLFFIPKIQLDTSLRGGVQVQLQTNATINLQAVTSQLDSKIPGAQASIEASPGGVLITIASNQSLANAEEKLLSIYSIYSNYTAANVNATILQDELRNQPGNSTLSSQLSSAISQESKNLAFLNSNVSEELSILKVFVNPPKYNASSAESMLEAAKNTYSNASARYQNFVVNTLKGIIPFTQYSYEEETPTLGAFFLSQLKMIIIAAFVLVAIVVFFIFRTPIPSLAVIFGAGNDIIVALGAMGAFGIPLGVASIGGLLMLIGYSIDTDMLTSIRILKRSEGTPTERALGTMKTGITMTSAAIISFGILLIISYFAFIQTYFEISGVVLFGLLADLATTWLGNLPIILWYKKRKVQQ